MRRQSQSTTPILSARRIISTISSYHRTCSGRIFGLAAIAFRAGMVLMSGRPVISYSLNQACISANGDDEYRISRQRMSSRLDGVYSSALNITRALSWWASIQAKYWVFPRKSKPRRARLSIFAEAVLEKQTPESQMGCFQAEHAGYGEI